MQKIVNVNPSKHITEDSFVRSLTLALNIPYREAFKVLSDYALGASLAMTDIRAFKGLLKAFGYYEKQIQRKCNVVTFAEIYAKSDKTYILRVGRNTSTVIKNKVIYDNYDVSKKIINSYWIIN